MAFFMAFAWFFMVSEVKNTGEHVDFDMVSTVSGPSKEVLSAGEDVRAGGEAPATACDGC